MSPRLDWRSGLAWWLCCGRAGQNQEQAAATTIMITIITWTTGRRIVRPHSHRDYGRSYALDAQMARKASRSKAPTLSEGVRTIPHRTRGRQASTPCTPSTRVTLFARHCGRQAMFTDFDRNAREHPPKTGRQGHVEAGCSDGTSFFPCRNTTRGRWYSLH